MSEGTWTSLKCRTWFSLSVIAFSFLCIAVAAVIIVAVFVLFMEDCVGCSLHSKLLGNIAAALSVAGLLILLALLCYKGRHIDRTPQVVVSLIPAEDLDNPAAPILPFVRVPRCLPYIETSSINSLPDYFTVVQNADEVYSSVDADVWTENVTETPPPSYEEALEMATFTA